MAPARSTRIIYCSGLNRNMPGDGMPWPTDLVHINSLGELLECNFAITVAEEVGLARLPVATWVRIIRFVESPCDHFFDSAHEHIEHAGFLVQSRLRGETGFVLDEGIEWRLHETYEAVRRHEVDSLARRCH